jgi:NAD(P)-dependent dehydrogenase (short-subunit alcohol dehydrogenase family)
MKIFAGRVAFVTGGASGIGYGIVQNLLKEGMKIVIADWKREHLSEVRQALSGRDDVHFVQVDVSNRDQMRAAADEAIRVFGKIHVLCNNAGVGGGGNVHDPDFEGWDRAMSVNLGGVVNGVKIITPLILSHGEGGHIVNTSSMAGIVPQPIQGLGAYQTAKFAVRGLSEYLRISLAPHGIGVSCLFPGGTRSRIIVDHVKDDPQRAEAVKQMVATWMDPVELGAHVVAGIRNNAPYILPHATGFPEEVRELNALLESAFPLNQRAMPELEAFEVQRRAMIRHARSLPIKD